MTAGGKREGAGRPAKYDTRASQQTFTMPADTIQALRKYSHGMNKSMSEVITRVIQQFLKGK